MSFQWRDFRDGQSKIMTVSAVEFLRRFLQHVLPSGLVKIRHFGWLANRSRKPNLALCRRLLEARPIPAPAMPEPKPDRPCPTCANGILRTVEWLDPFRIAEAARTAPIVLDTS